MNFYPVPSNVTVCETQDVGKPSITDFVPFPFKKEVHVGIVVGTSFISPFYPESGVKLSNNLIIPLKIESHYVFHLLGLISHQGQGHFTVSNIFTSTPIDGTLMQDRLIFLGKNNSVVEIHTQ
jgi:hypothetical protein